jgi:hypothetical protein
MDLTAQPSSYIDELRKLRVALGKSLPRIDLQNSARSIGDALADPLFPFTFLLRNVRLLRLEAGWRVLSAEAKRRSLLNLLRERCGIFYEVRGWLEQKTGESDLGKALRAQSQNPAKQFGYCGHCGGCCEIAGGLADFPAGVKIPSAWIDLFGNGLGPYHRFCPFLWESGGEGLSLCAIHVWRPNPCRLFAEEECRFLLADPDFNTLGDPAALLHAGGILAACLAENPATERALTSENAENQ